MVKKNEPLKIILDVKVIDDQKGEDLQFFFKPAMIFDTHSG